MSEDIDGACLLDDVEAFLRRFVAFPSEAARVATVLWAAHAHLLDVFDSTPRLAFLSPEPGSGKTRALEITELLVPNPMLAVSASTAALFRSVNDLAGRPTILQFWYRQSPDELGAESYHDSFLIPGIVTDDDPATTTSGMVNVKLDARGR